MTRLAKEHDVDPGGSLTRLATETYVDEHAGPAAPDPIDLETLNPLLWACPEENSGIAGGTQITEWLKGTPLAYDLEFPGGANKPTIVENDVDGFDVVAMGANTGLRTSPLVTPKTVAGPTTDFSVNNYGTDWSTMLGGAFSITGGNLVPSADGQAKWVTAGQFSNVRVRTKVASAGDGNGGVLLKVNAAGTAWLYASASLGFYKYQGGWTGLGGGSIGLAADDWLEFEISGNYLIRRRFGADGVTLLAVTTLMLTGADAAAFGEGVSGYVGLSSAGSVSFTDLQAFTAASIPADEGRYTPRVAKPVIFALLKLQADQAGRQIVSQFDGGTANGFGFGIADGGANGLKNYAVAASSSSNVELWPAVTSGAYHLFEFEAGDSERRLVVDGGRWAGIAPTGQVNPGDTGRVPITVGYFSGGQNINARYAEVAVLDKSLITYDDDVRRGVRAYFAGKYPSVPIIV